MFKTRVCVWAVPKVRTILVLGIAQRLPVLDTGWYFYWLSYPILIVLRHLDTSSVAVASRWRLVKLERRYNKTRVLGMCGRWQITRCVSVIIPSSHHTIAHNLVVVMTSQSGGAYMGPGGGRCSEEMRNSTRLSPSWNTSVMWMESSKYCWHSAAYFWQKRSKCSAVSSPFPQWGQIGDVIRPIKAWYEAADVSLLSLLSWWIAPAMEHQEGELTITASQMPVGCSSRFALSHLTKFLVRWLHSELPQVLDRWSHVNVWLIHPDDQRQADKWSKILMSR